MIVSKIILRTIKSNAFKATAYIQTTKLQAYSEK